jgi:hypothetical protein
MKDEKLEAALKQFAEIVPEEQLKQMLDGVVPAKNEVAIPVPGFMAPALTIYTKLPAWILTRYLSLIRQRLNHQISFFGIIGD